MLTSTNNQSSNTSGNKLILYHDIYFFFYFHGGLFCAFKFFALNVLQKIYFICFSSFKNVKVYFNQRYDKSLFSLYDAFIEIHCSI